MAWNYIKSGRFVVDLLASIPFERIYLLFASNSDNQTAFQLLGLLKLIRLLRLGRVIRYMKFKTGLKIGIRILQLLFFLLMVVHWIACVWFLLVKSPDSWMPPKDLDKKKTNFYEIGIIEQYVVCFYYSMLTMVGNELAPRNNL